MVMVSSRLQKQFETSAPPSEVLALLGSVPEAARHMPDIEQLEPGPETGSYNYKLKKIGAGPISVQVSYRSVFEVDDATSTVTWRPVDGVGNSMTRGSWKLSAKGDGTRIELDSEFGVEIPVPRIMKGAADSLLDREYNRVLDTYCANLKKTLDGGDGRLR